MNTTRIAALLSLLISGIIAGASTALTDRPLITASAAPPSQPVVQTGYAGDVRSVAFSPDGSPEPAAQGAEEISDANWQRHPEIVAIRKIVHSVNEGLKKRTFKTSERKFESCPDQYFTLRRIARDSKGHVAWYEEYAEGEDSSWDYHQYYDQAGRLRFALIIVYAANGTREQHRVYFDESGKLIRQSRKLLKGPGYFAPYKVEELVKDDPAREFANTEGCVEMKPKPGRRAG